MRVRNLLVILAVFGAAAAAAAFVVSQFPRERPLRSAGAVTEPPAVSPPVATPASLADGAVAVRVTAGPEPLAGAEVRLYAPPEAPGAPWHLAAEARTGPSGTASLPARPGRYLVAARGGGLAPGRAEVVRPPGDATARVDVVLEPPAVAEGRASTGSGPVAGARVQLVPLASDWPGFAPPSAPPEEITIVETDASGAFRAGGLAPGAYAVTLDAPGYHPVTVRRIAVPGDVLVLSVERLGTIEGLALLDGGRPAAGATVRAASTEHGAAAVAGPDGRFRLVAPAGTYLLLAVLGDRAGAGAAPVSVTAGATTHAPSLPLGAAASVQGRVTRGAETAAPAAELALLAHGTGEIVARAVAGEDCRFALGPLAPAAYDLAALARGASPALVPGVTLRAGERFEVPVRLAGTGAVTGTIRDAGGHALASIPVRATAAGEGLLAVPPVETRTDFEGRYRLAPLPAGRIELVAREERLRLGVGRAVTVTQGRDSAADLVLPGAGVLSGRVSAGGGGPLPPGTTVVVVTLTGGAGVQQTSRAATDARGNFELPVPAGEYRVHAAPGAAALADLRVAPSFARVAPGQTTRLALTLAPPPRETGVEILVLEPGGAPSPGATVTLARPDDGRIALATAAGGDGRVAIDGRMGMSGHPVTVRAWSGGRSGSATLVLPEAGTVAIHLAPAATVSGLVRGARGGFTLEVASQPAAGAWRTLEVHRFAGDRFELGDLPPEPLRLVARAEDGRRGAVEVRVGAGEKRTVEIGLR